MIVFDLKKSLDEISNMLKSYSIYLTGSRSNNSFTTVSDLDLIIVSDYFKEMNHDVRRKMLASIFCDTDVHVDPLCLTTIEFERFMNELPSFSVVPIRLGGDFLVC